MNSIAIIIPAYKPDFLDEAIECIVNQTNNKFHLYIYNDASPHDLDVVVSKYINKYSNITYHKFEENLGGKDLVNHWNRCVAKIGDEDWVWLFSDDDLMSDDCVESFYKELSYSEKYFDVYRFNTYIVDKDGIKMGDKTNHPKWESSKDFLERRLLYSTTSYITDYIFSKKTYEENGGFVNFDAAWAADDATWVLFGFRTGIKLISGNAHIEWRSSGINISTSVKSDFWKLKKLSGTKQFVSWLRMQDRKRKLRLNFAHVLTWHITQIKWMEYNMKFVDFCFNHLTKYPLRAFVNISFLKSARYFGFEFLKKDLQMPKEKIMSYISKSKYLIKLFIKRYILFRK